MKSKLNLLPFYSKYKFHFRSEMVCVCHFSCHHSIDNMMKGTGAKNKMDQKDMERMHYTK